MGCLYEGNDGRAHSLTHLTSSDSANYAVAAAAAAAADDDGADDDNNRDGNDGDENIYTCILPKGALSRNNVLNRLHLVLMQICIYGNA